MHDSAEKPGLLIVDDDPIIADTLGYFLAADFAVSTVGNRRDALDWLQQQAAPPKVALVDLGLPPMPHRPQEGFALIGEMLTRVPQLRIVVLSGQSDSDNARHARALGAVEFVAKPVPPDQLRALLLRFIDLGREPEQATELPMVGGSPPMQKLRQQLRQFADSPFPVLIEGESGSGKELAAAALHKLSSRAGFPYLVLNCAAIAPTLVESTLFGHAKGSFTGASISRGGFFEEAGPGTLLLDEIGELPLELQPKLLRVIEKGEYQPVGETQTRISRARILAATNRDLRQEVRAGRFRADLYHRLSVFSVVVPPLRELGEDRLLLLEHYGREIARQLGQPGFQLTPAARTLWMDYPFPGNVRELRNIVIRLATQQGSGQIEPETLREEFDPLVMGEASSASGAVPAAPLAILEDRAQLVEAACRELSACNGKFRLDDILHRWEDAYIEAARRLSEGNMSRAARLLGINRTTLYNRLETLAREKSGGHGR